MSITKSLLASAALVASLGGSAGAQVTGSLGGPIGPFLSLSGAANCSLVGTCTLGGAVGTISGGSIFASDQPFADIPAGSVFGGLFLAAGPTASEPSTITFAAGLSGISFLWGSPDLYNRLVVTSNLFGEQTFTATDLNFGVTNGNQNFSQYVKFDAGNNNFITKLEFFNNPSTNAFEVANFNVEVGGATVPEPASFALIAAGLLGMVGMARRRQNSSI